MKRVNSFSSQTAQLYEHAWLTGSRVVIYIRSAVIIVVVVKSLRLFDISMYMMDYLCVNSIMYGSSTVQY